MSDSRRTQPPKLISVKPPERRRITAWHAPTGQHGRQPDVEASARALRLSRLVPLWPSEIDKPGLGAAQRVIGALERALRGERRRGRAGHWTYDLNRHLALARTLREERARLTRLRPERNDALKAAAQTSAADLETKSMMR